MKVPSFNEKTTNRPKHGAKKDVKTQGSAKLWEFEGSEPRILRDAQVLSGCELKAT